jgi:sucrose-6-phosphate hydrolase SacC (GH32 family)
MYANAVPTSPWRSAMTIPRALRLRRLPGEFRLIQEPVAELRELRTLAPLKFAGGSLAEAAQWLDEHKSLPELLDVEMSISDVSGKGPFTVNLHTGKEEFTALMFDPSRNQLAVDRAKSGQTAFHKAFAARHEAPLCIRNDSLSVRFLLDTSSIEVFANDGETVITELIFPAAGPRRLSVTSGEGPTPTVRYIAIHPLRSAW